MKKKYKRNPEKVAAVQRDVVHSGAAGLLAHMLLKTV